MIPGEYQLKNDDIDLCVGREPITLTVANTGDRIRFGDTELWIEIEHDHTHYGEEVMFGGGKVIRDGMGQSQRYDDGQFMRS